MKVELTEVELTEKEIDIILEWYRVVKPKHKREKALAMNLVSHKLKFHEKKPGE